MVSKTVSDRTSRKVSDAGTSPHLDWTDSSLGHTHWELMKGTSGMKKGAVARRTASSPLFGTTSRFGNERNFVIGFGLEKLRHSSRVGLTSRILGFRIGGVNEPVRAVTKV